MRSAVEYRWVNLGIGDIVVMTAAARITTVLGSCISVCLFDEERAVGGMNHFMLPAPMGSRNGTPGRFGSESIPELVRRMAAAGARRGRTVAKVFGGGNVLAGLSGAGSVAGRNIEVARHCLVELHIPVVAEDTGGSHGRKVDFFTDSGKVLVRAVEHQQFLTNR